jgi:hypothetical protein
MVPVMTNVSVSTPLFSTKTVTDASWPGRKFAGPGIDADSWGPALGGIDSHDRYCTGQCQDRDYDGCSGNIH